MQSAKCKVQSGFVAISVVVILIAVVIAAGTTITLLSINEAQSGLVLYKGEENLDFVEGCVEDYMLKIRSQGNSFVAGNITRPEGTCTIIVNSSGSWDINVSTTSTKYKRTINVNFNRTSTAITLTSWKEI